jgi:hypothetical protein
VEVDAHWLLLPVPGCCRGASGRSTCQAGRQMQGADQRSKGPAALQPLQAKATVQA